MVGFVQEVGVTEGQDPEYLRDKYQLKIGIYGKKKKKVVICIDILLGSAHKHRNIRS